MTSHQLLLIEDDVDIASIVARELHEAGHQVVVAPTLMQGLLLAREQRPDLLLLDLGLPDGHGSAVLTRLRKTTTLPIIVLTANDDVGEKVRLLQLGANDYVVKPVHPDELLARIAVQLRQDTYARLRLGTLELQPHQRLATADGREIHLSPREFDLLCTLMQEPGRVHSRGELYSACWRGELAEPSNLIDVHMANLRGKLRSAGLSGLVRTVRGFGYAIRRSSTASS